MEDKKQIYSKRTFVCWPIKIGGASATWPFGKVVITPDCISLSILFFGQYDLKKEDIINIEFVSGISDKLFSIRLFGKSNLCKITTNGEKLPNWLAFYANEKDKGKLNEFGFSKKLTASVESKTIKNDDSRDNFKILRILILLVSLTIAAIAISMPFWFK